MSHHDHEHTDETPLDDAAIAAERERFLSEAAWDERYRERETAIWSGNPNPVLVAEAADLTPGRALDVGCGEGADALWLAERGWAVTGVDISTVALERAAAVATARGLDVDWVHANLLEEPPAAGAYDLVSAQFMHLPETERRRMYTALAAAVAPGGTLLVGAHDPSDLHTTMGRPHLTGMFFTPAELRADLPDDGWDVIVAESRPRTAADPEGRAVTVHDAVLVLRRRV